MKANRFLASLVFVCFLLCGCEYSHEVTEMAYSVAIGMDQKEDGLRVTFQFARPLSIAGEGVAEEETPFAPKNENTAVLSVTAGDFYTALSLAENSLSKKINLSHTKLLLFSEELAQGGLYRYASLFMKNSQFSPNAYTAVSPGSAEEYVRAVNPALEHNPAKYYTLLFAENSSDATPSATLRELYFDIANSGREPVLPLAMLRDSNAVGSENQTSVSGMAVLSEGRLAQFLTEQDAVSYHVLTGKLREIYLVLPSPSAERGQITLRIKQRKSPKKQAALTDESPILSAQVFLSAEIAECSSADMETLGFDGISRLAAQELSARLSDFLHRSAVLCRADVVGFGNLAKMQFSDLAAWNQYHWAERYPNAKFRVQSDVVMAKEGLVQIR